MVSGVKKMSKLLPAYHVDDADFICPHCDGMIRESLTRDEPDHTDWQARCPHCEKILTIFAWQVFEYKVN